MATGGSDLDGRASALAARQLGLITRRQAAAIGFSADQIDRRLRLGVWRRARRGVYVVGGAPMTPEQKVLAACLAGPKGAVASHLSAAFLYNLLPEPAQVHLTVPRRATARSAGSVAHRADLHRKDRAMVGIIPVTHPARTVVDCATLLAPAVVTRLLDDALARELTRPHLIEDAAQRSSTRPGRKGVPIVAEALKAWADGIQPGSPAEMRLLRRLGEWGFPLPVRQYVVRSSTGRFLGRLDLAWPLLLIGIEYDGQGSHTPRQLQHDEARHGPIVEAGWELYRVDKRDLRPSADRLRRELSSAFDRRRIA